MATAIDADYSVPPLDKKQHLRIPVIGAQWPAMMKYDWFSLAQSL
jgi:hypothetical protein